MQFLCKSDSELVLVERNRYTTWRVEGVKQGRDG